MFNLVEVYERLKSKPKFRAYNTVTGEEYSIRGLKVIDWKVDEIGQNVWILTNPKTEITLDDFKMISYGLDHDKRLEWEAKLFS